MQRQWARTQWMVKGYNNTKYFHAMATKRKQRNFIKGIRDEDGAWQSDEGVVSKIFVEFYIRLFSSSNVPDLDRVLEGVQRVVMESMNAKLKKPYSREEVVAAINQMAPSKALGPNWMPPPPLFISLFRRMWDLMSLMLHFHVLILVLSLIHQSYFHHFDTKSFQS